MFRLDVLQNQWLILALVGGTALVLFVALAYVAVWRGVRNGSDASAKQGVSPERPTHSIPAIVVVFWVAAAVYAAVYVALAIMNPPTW
jgi:hypothetical protein